MASSDNTIFEEQAQVVQHNFFEGDQAILRLYAPKTATSAQAGQFVHLRCHDLVELRRPISIMQADKQQGTIDLLYKILGKGTQLLSQLQENQTTALLGPIGKPFQVNKARPLLIGGGVGMPPMIFIADGLKNDPNYSPFAILGSEVPFPFITNNSNINVNGIAENINLTSELLESWNIPTRLASLQHYNGCFQGYVTELATLYLDALTPSQRSEVEIFSCGPHPMLDAVAQLAAKYQLDSQLSLEEYMACGIGGCAGCTVPVFTDSGKSMKRVCVDGPVFSAPQIFPDYFK
jgi:dihydroorotate dehydrogenase electron transfer subunit